MHLSTDVRSHINNGWGQNVLTYIGVSHKIIILWFIWEHSFLRVKNYERQ